MDLDKIQQVRDQQAQQADVEKQDGQHQEIAATLNNLLLATMVSKDPKMVEVAQNLANLLSSIGQASDQFNNSSLHLLPLANQELAASIQDLTSRIEQYSPHDLEPYFEALVSQLQAIAGTPPVVNVPKQPISVDLKPLLEGIKELQKEVKANKINIPATDMSEVVKQLKAVQKTINGLTFPVPNYILPFKDPTTGKATQVTLTAAGELPVDVSVGDVTAIIAVPTTLLAFVTTVTTAGTRVQLATNTMVNGAILEAPSTNTGLIYVGGSNVSSTVYGAELQPGQSTSVAIDNTSKVWVDSSVSGDKVACLGG